MTEIMHNVREVLSANEGGSLAMNEILKRIQKQHKLVHIDKDKLKETLDYYSKLYRKMDGDLTYENKMKVH